jgi:hypothetical protein
VVRQALGLSAGLRGGVAKATAASSSKMPATARPWLLCLAKHSSFAKVGCWHFSDLTGLAESVLEGKADLPVELPDFSV